MKREHLKELGLTDEQIEKVMAENGKDVQAEQANTTAKQAEIDTLTENIKALKKDLKDFKDMNVDEIKAKSEELQTKVSDLEAELKDAREAAMLDKALSAVDTHDVDVVKNLLNRKELVFKDGEVIGLDSQIKALKNDKPYLFKEQEDTTKAHFTKQITKQSTNAAKITKEQFANMSYFDRVELKQNDEALYNELVKGE